MEITNTHITSA